LKVDFWPLPPTRPFDVEMFARRVRVDIFREPAWIATAEDVILHKLYWDLLTPSERQLGDAAGVAAIQTGLDRAYPRSWASQLGVLQRLEDLLAGKILPKQT
jgi:hypothetical protein